MMVNQPLVSIVLPTYNGAQYLAKSVASCLAQSYTNWELIVVDDASTDHTPAVIADLVALDKRIQTVRHLQNRRLPAALNSGFAQAQGNYLTWTSDDNCYRPEALAKMVTFLESHSEIGLVYADHSIIDKNDVIIKKIVVGEPAMLAYNNCIGACFLYRRQVFLEVGSYVEDLFLAEDYDFWLRVSTKSGLTPLHEDLYLYRHHEKSLTATRQAAIKLATETALMRNLPAMSWLGKGDLAKAYLNLAQQAVERKDGIIALQHVVYALRHVPGLIRTKRVRTLLSRSVSAFISPKQQFTASGI